MANASTSLTDTLGRSEEDRKVLRDKVQQVNRYAEEHWNDPQWRREMAAEMTQTIYTGFESENILSLLSTVENAGFNDRVFVKEVRGLRAFWVARGGYIEASEIKSSVLELPRDTIGFHVYEMEDKIMTNFAETQATLVQLGIQRLDAEVNRRVLALFQAAIPASSPYYTSGSGLSLNSLNAAIRAVRDASREYQITIVGRNTMTEQIIDLLTAGPNAGFLPETNESILRNGVLGTYRGARIVTLRNFKDDDERSFWPANEMYVIGQDASKFAFWGGLMSKEYLEDDNWYWHYLARRDFGGVVHRPARLRRIIDTAQTA